MPSASSAGSSGRAELGGAVLQRMIARGSHVARTSRDFARVFKEAARHAKMARLAKGADDQLAAADLARIAQSFGQNILDIFQVEVEWRGAEPSPSPTLFVGNHISYFDIPLLMSRVPVAFVAKAEVRRIPVFGQGAAHGGAVLVQRNSSSSRQKAAYEVTRFLTQRQQSVAIFPSGTTSLSEHKPWRHGPFVIAREAGIPLQAFRLHYDPLRDFAYIDDDFIMTHLWRLLGASRRLQRKLRVVVEFAPPRLVEEPVREAEELRQWTRAWQMHAGTLHENQ